MRAKKPFIRKKKNSGMLIPPAGIGKSIICILAEEPNLTTKQIYIRALRRGKRFFTYQATHKKIKSLVNEEILKKTSDSYCLNPAWLEQLTNFIETAKQKTATQCIGENSNIQEIGGYFKSKYSIERVEVR